MNSKVRITKGFIYVFLVHRDMCCWNFVYVVIKYR